MHKARRSRANSNNCIPGLAVELVGIETRGDRILDAPLSSVEGKEFFTDEIDAALLAGKVDFTVHSFKDLSLERASSLLLAAVPAREQPHDIAVFAADVPERLAAGDELVIGSSSPRRAAFVPDFLQRVLPQRASDRRSLPRVRLVDLRGNVDSRLRRLHEPRGAARHLDGIVLAFCGARASVGRCRGRHAAARAVRAAAAHGAAAVAVSGGAGAGRARGRVSSR